MTPVWLGYDPRQSAGAPDSNGLVWRDPAADVHTLALGFAALPDSSINQAIDEAVELGEREALIDVAVLTGRCCQALGRAADATAAYRRALELAGASDEPVAGRSFAAHLGLAELGDDPLQRTIAATTLWPTALSESAAWWDFPRLWRRLRNPEGALAAALEAPELGASLEAVRRAATQRLDC